MKKSFQLGDRVKLATPEARALFHAMKHGVIVNYHGQHDPANPRVRWESGWGVTSKAKKLIRLTPEEASALPFPVIVEGDL